MIGKVRRVVEEQDCHCLCTVNHRYARGICEGVGKRVLVFKGKGRSTPVPMCEPCADETLAHKKMEDVQRNGTRF